MAGRRGIIAKLCKHQLVGLSFGAIMSSATNFAFAEVVIHLVLYILQRSALYSMFSRTCDLVYDIF
eukprot:833044-Pyramimonas_sp.AAC.1